MKKINIELIKDLFISLLITISIILVISVIFYDKISFSRVIPEAEEYMLTDEMQTDLNESYTEDVTEIITNYSIDAADLKQYEKATHHSESVAVGNLHRRAGMGHRTALFGVSIHKSLPRNALRPLPNHASETQNAIGSNVWQ